MRTQAAFFGLLVLASACTQSQRDAQKCAHEEAPDLVVRYCTAAIESGRLSDTERAIAFYNRGSAYGEKGEHDRAIQDFDIAIRLKPDYAEAFYNRGVAYSQKGEGDRAIQNCDTAIRLKPDFAEAFNLRGWTYFNKDEYDRAIPDFEMALRLKPDSAVTFYALGIAYFRKGEYGRAIPDFDTALRLKPDYRNGYFARGLAHFYLGQFGTARDDFSSALRIDLRYPYSALWLFLAQARGGQRNSAELNKNAAALDLAKWPGQVIKFYLGKVSSEQLLSAANDPASKKRDEQHCQAYFYLGEDALLHGEQEEATRRFKQAIATGVTDVTEYAAAKAEIEQMKAPATPDAAKRH